MSVRTTIRLLIAALLLTTIFPAIAQAQDTEQVILISDNFDTPTEGFLPVSRNDDFRFAYDDGKYEIDAFAADFSGDLSVPIPGEFPNGSIAIDGTLTGKNDGNGHYLFLGCRMQDQTGYKLEVRPFAQVIAIWLMSPDGNTRIANLGLDSEPGPGPFSIAFSCLGNELTGYVDGEEVISVTDDTYTTGGFTFGAGVYKISAGPVSADFDNLTIWVPADEVPDVLPVATETSTPEPTATATSEPTETPTETPTPEPTREPTETPTAAPTQEPTQTPTLEPTATPTETPFFSQAATFDRAGLAAAADQLRTQASSQPALFGPVSGQTDLDTGQQVADFAISTSFTVPDQGAWSAGYAFRQTSEHSAIIQISSDGVWMLTAGTEQVRAAGVVDQLDTNPGAVNTIELIAVGDTGYLTIDDAFVAQLDLSLWPDTGALTVIGAVADNGGPLAIADVTVWPMGATEPAEIIPTEVASAIPATPAPPEPTATASPVREESTATPETSPVAQDEQAVVFQQILDTTTSESALAGPKSGALTQAIGSLDIASAQVIVENFYSTVRVANPDNPAAPDHPWDIVLGFWHTGGDNQVRLVIASDGAWSLALGTARPILNGTIDNLHLGQDGENKIGLAVLDGTGYLAVNDTFITSFDIPSQPRAGDLWLASGTFPENAQEGVQTSYSDWTIWSLEQG